MIRNLIIPIIRLAWITFKSGWWIPLAALYAVQHAQADTIYKGGGAGTAYSVTITKSGASFVRHGPHQAGATLQGAEMVSQTGNTNIYAAPIPRKFWSAFAGARRPVECRLAVTFGDQGKAITGIRASQPCTFFHGATLGFGLYGGGVLRLTPSSSPDPQPSSGCTASTSAMSCDR